MYFERKLNFSVVLVCGRAMKLLLVSINFSLVIVQLGKVIQEIQLEVINTIVCTLYNTGTASNPWVIHTRL